MSNGNGGSNCPRVAYDPATNTYILYDDAVSNSPLVRFTSDEWDGFKEEVRTSDRFDISEERALVSANVKPTEEDVRASTNEWQAFSEGMETLMLDGGVAVRDPRNPDAQLLFHDREWDVLLEEIRDETFELAELPGAELGQAIA